MSLDDTWLWTHVLERYDSKIRCGEKNIEYLGDLAGEAEPRDDQMVE